MSDPISRRAALLGMSGGLLALTAGIARAQTKISITVYKDPTCGCCHMWVQHMQANGFTVSVIDGDIKPIKTKFNVPSRLESCHTAVVNGLVIEGHVPAADVKKFLAAKPKDVIGLTIPGMPASAPGMDAIPFKPYEVLTFDKSGRTTVFAKHDKA